tara:strand:- start:3139 stop:4047 length:909 start_codon:yes stop_codon:yes gene_type:complete
MSETYICVIGGGKDSIFLIEELKKKLQKILLIDKDKNCPASKLAEVHLCISTWDSQEIISQLANYKIKWCVTRSSGIPVITTSKICEKYKFNTVASNCVKELSSKKGIYSLKNIDNIKFPKLYDVRNLDSVEYIENLDFPLVVKPEFESVGKKGTFIIHEADDIKNLLSKSAEYLAYGDLILQSYIRGYDHSLIGICLDGKYESYALLKEKNEFSLTNSINHFGFEVLNNLNLENKLSKIAQEICVDREIQNTPLNFNFRIDKEDFFLLECNFDFGGEDILEILKYDYNRDIIKAYLDKFLS